MIISRENGTDGSSTVESGAATFQQVLWAAIDSGDLTRKALAQAIDMSEDSVGRMLFEDPLKLMRYREIGRSRRLPESLRRAFLEWFTRDSGFVVVAADRATRAELDANKDGRVDGRDAICFEGQALSQGSAALEALCVSIDKGTLSRAQRAEVRERVREMKVKLGLVEQCLDVEEAGVAGLRISK